MAKNNDITKIDKNFAKLGTDEERIVYYDANAAPFSVHGLIYEKGEGYVRVPSAIAKQVSPGFDGLNNRTAGGRIRFSTDSQTISVKCQMKERWMLVHMADTGSAGFDIYTSANGVQKYAGTLMPDKENKKDFCASFNFPTSEMRDIIIGMPLFSSVDELMIGVCRGSVLTDGGPYKYRRPIVFYGSSITNGACACRPGNMYEAIISRRFDADYVCLGYSGSAKAEPAIIDYMSKLDMRIFVFDYDYNAPSAEYLEKTHYSSYAKIRERNPYLPIILASCPNFSNPLRDGKARRDIISATYEKALAEGDKNIYFIDGEKEFATFFDDGCTVDGTHPTDVGFERMAKAFGDVMEKILKVQ